MTKITITAVILSCILTTMAFAGESYLCVADVATGFKYNKAIDKWESTNLNIDDKFVVSKTIKGIGAWEIKPIGKTWLISKCKKDFNKDGYLECQGIESFYMSKNNLRFILISHHGYVKPEQKKQDGSFLFKEGDVTPWMMIGKCSPLP